MPRTAYSDSWRLSTSNVGYLELPGVHRTPHRQPPPGSLWRTGPSRWWRLRRQSLGLCWPSPRRRSRCQASTLWCSSTKLVVTYVCCSNLANLTFPSQHIRGWQRNVTSQPPDGPTLRVCLSTSREMSAGVCVARLSNSLQHLKCCLLLSASALPSYISGRNKNPILVKFE